MSDNLAAQRMRVAFELADLAEAMLRQRMRREHPEATRDAIEARVHAWRSERPCAPHGDAEGRPVPWPRPRRVP